MVDLDGTLIKGDMLVTALRQLLARKPLQLLRLLPALSRGRVEFKHQVARRVSVDPGLLPCDARVLQCIKAARSAGREVVLATGSHQLHADLIAGHLGLFDSVLGSSSALNLKGQNKAAALVQRYGEGGFDYIGNSHADIPVWRFSCKSFLVNPDIGLESRLRRLKLNVHAL